MFVSGGFHAGRFVERVDDRVMDLLRDINAVGMEREQRRPQATTFHRDILDNIPGKGFWKDSFPSGWIQLFNDRFGQSLGTSLGIRAGVCYACLFGRPEYVLPCSHTICFDCVKEFDQSPAETKYPGISLIDECMLCKSRDEEGWPYRAKYHADLRGVSVLSLDGGGVRGIIPLSILKRLEETLDLGVPLGELFDLMVGTSAGKFGFQS
jgi:hypothetical protein